MLTSYLNRASSSLKVSKLGKMVNSNNRVIAENVDPDYQPLFMLSLRMKELLLRSKVELNNEPDFLTRDELIIEINEVINFINTPSLMLAHDLASSHIQGLKEIADEEGTSLS